MEQSKGLTVVWTDPRGKEWNLTSGRQGVVLATDQMGLGWPGIEHTYARGGAVHVASHVKRGVHNLKVLVGEGLVGQAFFDVYREWWTQANSPFEEGELAVTTPDDETRTRRLRLNDTPDTSHLFDPGLGLTHTPELWSLTGSGGWWLGEEQCVTYTPEPASGDGDTPFYGPNGAGWPLYIASVHTVDALTLTNDGQGPMWLTWVLVGPMSNPTVGFVDGGVIHYKGDLLPNEVVYIVTSPEGRRVVTGNGLSRYDHVEATWAPAPSGGNVPLLISAGSFGAGAKVRAIGRPAYGTAF